MRVSGACRTSWRCGCGRCGHRRRGSGRRRRSSRRRRSGRRRDGGGDRRGGRRGGGDSAPRLGEFVGPGLRGRVPRAQLGRLLLEEHVEVRAQLGLAAPRALAVEHELALDVLQAEHGSAGAVGGSAGSADGAGGWSAGGADGGCWCAAAQGPLNRRGDDGLEDGAELTGALEHGEVIDRADHLLVTSRQDGIQELGADTSPLDQPGTEVVSRNGHARPHGGPTGRARRELQTASAREQAKARRCPHHAAARASQARRPPS